MNDKFDEENKRITIGIEFVVHTYIDEEGLERKVQFFTP